VDGAARARRFPAGNAWIELVEPAPRAAALRAWLDRRGQLPYEVTLASRGGQGALAARDTHGVRFRIAEEAPVPT
jgi:hypothetical protein